MVERIIMGYIQNYLQRCWDRLPMMFGVLGLAFLGFGRKAQRAQANGGTLPDDIWGYLFIAIGILVFAYQLHRNRSESTPEPSASAE